MYEIGSVLSVRKDFYRHVGVYAGDGMVFHNHPNSGQQLVSIDQFSGGRKIRVKKAGALDKQAFVQRLQQAQQQPNSYNLFLRNCEHTASTLRSGSANSPQLWLYSGMSVLILAGSLVLSRAARR
jgi:hypothetical protein